MARFSKSGVSPLPGSLDGDEAWGALVRRRRLRVAALLLLALALSLSLLCFAGWGGSAYPGAYAYRVFAPGEAARALTVLARDAVDGIIRPLAVPSGSVRLASYPAYFTVASRIPIVLVTVLCGAMVGVSGLLYQVAFRNPVANAGMVGASSGAQLGFAALVLMQSSGAVTTAWTRYELAFGGGCLALLAALGIGRLIGARTAGTSLLILIGGMMFAQLIKVVVSYLTLYVMDPVEYQAFYMASQVIEPDASGAGLAVAACTAALSLLPVAALRGRMGGLLVGDDDEARMLGVDAGRMRAVAVVAGGLMMVCASVAVGEVALVGLLAPFLGRRVLGMRFSDQLIGSALTGCILLLACRLLVDAVPVPGGAALGLACSAIALPLFVLLVSNDLRGWGR